MMISSVSGLGVAIWRVAGNGNTAREAATPARKIAADFTRTMDSPAALIGSLAPSVVNGRRVRKVGVDNRSPKSDGAGS